MYFCEQNLLLASHNQNGDRTVKLVVCHKDDEMNTELSSWNYTKYICNNKNLEDSKVQLTPNPIIEILNTKFDAISL